jgi:3-deoxy-D-manno-octulosonate 8-phosphate phosphatase KdsC-like HAD superfamily phosphatase
VASTSATRLWRTNKEAGRPWPVIVEDDDVIDYMVMEAVALKVSREDEDNRKDKERKDWRSDKGGMDRLREAVN